uniref:Ubiquitin carboxyl-terminal hydrolase 47 n=1 Tax=Ciona savignyi TaxID=51511 RepID=H2YIV6_CIOSA
FVGLVNQAMTCYLNSLIQTLYMTPEFRNAMYKWECDRNEDTTNSIHYQLQHLFLLMQTSNKESVETTGLTRSFGWDSSEAWQQHDIQELCRVMFDALEKTFQGTDQSDLIKRLYEGSMKDYVQCCECDHESARNDTFLDVPITIRPFGATTSYKSVMEGLNAFVEPETLDESNQYYCEKCAKKCDAKKGLKFIKFPYLLTLQLKRFDFDYSTMHRIKLNDCMQFPQILNLNSFTEETSKESTSSDGDPVNGEDMEEYCEAGKGKTLLSNVDGVDEGIDFESQRSNRRTRRDRPYVYELFSIMIHSGSAAGGHYYAYIKSFENNRWYSFNDQIVSPITKLDIEKTFGGVSYPRTSTSYYSTFSSSTNAYMLMYRQINHQRNAMFTETEDLPSHIQDLIRREEEEEKFRIMKIEQERNMCSIRLFCRHPSLLKHLIRPIVDETFEFHKDATLPEAVKQAHMQLKLRSDIIPVERCRLVKYDHMNDVLDRSYDIDSDDGGKTLRGPRNSFLFDLILETREEDEKFEKYEAGGLTLKVFLADPEIMGLRDQVTMRATEKQTVGEMKLNIAEKLNLPLDLMFIAREQYAADCRLLTDDGKTLKNDGFYRSAKVCVASSEPLKMEDTRLWQILDIDQSNLLTISIVLPPVLSVDSERSSLSTSCSTLGSTDTICHPVDGSNDELSPAEVVRKSVELNQAEVVAPCHCHKPLATAAPKFGAGKCYPGHAVPCASVENTMDYTKALMYADNTSDGMQSSEHKCDVDGTGDGPTVGLNKQRQSPIVTNEPVKSVMWNDNVSVAPASVGDNSDSILDSISRTRRERTISCSSAASDGWGISSEIAQKQYFFRVQEVVQFDYEENKPCKELHVEMDKRMPLLSLKRHLAHFVGTATRRFVVYRKFASGQENEMSQLTEDFRTMPNSTQFVVKLGRALRKDEYRCKLYQLKLDEEETAKPLMNWVIQRGVTVGEARKLLCEDISEQCDIHTQAGETFLIRIRKKMWKTPAQVYLESDKFGTNISLYGTLEFFVEFLDKAEPKTSANQLVLLCRRWRPSQLKFDDFQEVVLKEDTSSSSSYMGYNADHLIKQLEIMTGIPSENLQLAKGRGMFPFRISVLDADTNLDWVPSTTTSHTYSMHLTEDGTVIFYKDKTEELKEISEDERKSITDEEMKSDSTVSTATKLVSYRREKALKIYTPASRRDTTTE